MFVYFTNMNNILSTLASLLSFPLLLHTPLLWIYAHPARPTPDFRTTGLTKSLKIKDNN